jgi:hypothetical protein
MVERFNGRIADVLRSHRLQSGQDLEQTLLRYVALYNHQLPQSALKSKTPIQAMKDWYAKRPELFFKRPNDHPGCDRYPDANSKTLCFTSLFKRGSARGSNEGFHDFQRCVRVD